MYLDFTQELLTSLKFSFESEAFFHALELVHQLYNRLKWICLHSQNKSTTNELITNLIPDLVHCLEQEIYHQTSPYHSTILNFGNKVQIQIHQWRGDYVSKSNILDKDLFHIGNTKKKNILLVKRTTTARKNQLII